MIVDSANAKIVAEFPGLDRISWDGVFAFNSTASGSFCVFDCIEGEIFDIGFDESGEIFGFDPSSLNGCFNILINFPAGLSQYDDLDENNDDDERCNHNGYIFNPDVDVTSTFNAANGTISAAGQNTYVIIPVSAVTWAGRLAGLPPYIQLNLGTVDLGGVTISWTTFNVIITAIEKMKQDLLFTPRVDVNLDWDKTLSFKVLDGTTSAELQNSSGTDATFKVGDTLRLTTNAVNNKVIPITPTLSMGSATMSNNTRSSTSGELTLKALSFTIGTPPWEVCLGELGCLDIWDGETENFGPVYQENFAIGTADHNIFNSTFNIGGFNSPELDPFDIVPRPIIEVRKDLVPANSPGKFNLKIDSTVHATNVGDEGHTDRIPVEPGTRTISETEGTNADLNFFDISITCVEYDGGDVHTESAGASPGLGSSMDIELEGGEDLICTIKNRLPAPEDCDSMTFDNVILGTPDSNAADTLDGTNKRDIIIGYGGNDVIDSFLGDDCVAGNAGDDRISTGAGKDVVDGGTGDDTIDSGTDNDTVYGGDDDDMISSGNGNDDIEGGDGDDTILGGNNNDTIHGNAGADTINAGNGNDTVHGGGSNDNIIGGIGNDLLYGNSGSGDVINGGFGTDKCHAADGGGSASPGETVKLCEQQAPVLP
ncbi:MAG: hypothetical protein GEU75_04610 [Dehalococcoidia bacterium]|nr:hypothetical protein [Dehalococcoidia bacterium]